MNAVKMCDYSYMVSTNALDDYAREKMQELGTQYVDFADTQIINGSEKGFAEFIRDTGMIPVNLPDAILNKISYFITELSQPKFDSIDDKIEAEKKRFPEGTVCVLDELNSTLKTADNYLHIVMVEQYMGRRIVLRKYRSSTVDNPSAFRANGGLDGIDNFVREERAFEDWFNNAWQIRYPTDEEAEFIDALR